MEGRRRGLSLGFDIGGSKILAAVVDDQNRCIKAEKRPSVRDEGPEAVFERVVTMGRELIDEIGGVDVIGAGFAGLVDPRAGVVRSSIMLPGWDEFPLARRLSDAIDLPAFIDNDATVAGLGEYRALQSPPGMHLIVLTIGTGIGGAILLDGELYRGASGTAGEFGNMSIDFRGTPCWCGNRGCLNMLASGSAITASMDVEDPHPTVEEIANRARAGDVRAQEALGRAATALGAGLANVVNIFNPHRISLCGGVIGLGETFLDEVRRETASRAFREPMEEVVIDKSVLGERTGAHGAACLAWESLSDQR